MLSAHPHIERVHIHEKIINGRLTQKLIVETNLDVPKSIHGRNNQDLKNLEDYLSSLAEHDFVDFKEIEIRPYVAVVNEGRYAA